MNRAARIIAGALAACIALRAVGAGEATPSPPQTVPQLKERLGALTPAAPTPYFELGEEVACEMRDPAGVALARRLFLLAYTLESPGRPLRASACIALASLADNERDRRQLLALAEAMRPDTAAVSPGESDTGPARPAVGDGDTAYALATALGLYRSGENSRAAPLFDRADVRALLERFSTLLGGADAIVRDVKSHPFCRECHNQRIVRAEDSADANPPPMRLCYTCNGNPGPNLDPQKFLNQLRAEAVLLAGAGQSWSTQLLADRAAPLVELTPESLGALYSVDATQSVYRDGAWVKP